MGIFTAFISIIVLILSVMVHEVSHGAAADSLGDPTARLAGRLTLNPISHLDLTGSFIVPVLLYVVSGGSFVFGWAKPVPFNPYNIRQRWGEAAIAAAGPASNLIVALVFGILLRVALPVLPPAFVEISILIIFINIVLAIFNLVPIPPLDGSKILFSILPAKYTAIRHRIETFGLFLVILFIFFIWQWLFPVVTTLFEWFAGIPLGL